MRYHESMGEFTLDLQTKPGIADQSDDPLSMRFFTTLLLASVALSGASLPSGIIGAQYSASLDEVIMVTASPNLLHIYSPGSASDTTVSLPDAPLGLSVSPDGNYAAVLYNGWVSYVNLSSHAVAQTFPTGIASGSIVLSATYIYVFPSSQGGPLCINLSDGSQTSVNAEQASSARLDPALNSIYGARNDVSPLNLFQMTVTYGLPQSFGDGPYQGAYPVCGDTWFSSDGGTVYTGCGTAFHASDLTYAGSLDGLSAVQSLSASAAELAAIPAPSTGFDTEVRLYETQYLNQIGRFVLPNSAHGKWVFFNQGGTEVYIVAEAGSSFELDTIDLANPLTCAATFSSSTNVGVAATGALENAIISAGTGCAFQVTSSAAWISVISGAYGSGDTTLNYVVRPNTGSAQRIGTITLNSGATLTVNQAGWSGVSTALVNLSVNPVAADYSKALDKLVFVSAAPNELHLYDPNSQSDTFVPLALAPTALSVDPSGMFAAVGHDGWISYVSLNTLAVQQVFPIAADVSGLALSSNGYVYAFPKFDLRDVFALRLSDGTITEALDATGGQLPRLGSSATDIYVSGGELSQWDFSQTPPVISGSSIATCGNIWLSEDMARIYTGCADVYAAADFADQGAFSNAGAVQWAADAKQNNSVAVIPLHPPQSSTELIDSQLQIYSDANLLPVRGAQLAPFFVSGNSYIGHGKFAFWDSSESKLVVVEEADAAAPLISNYGVYVTSTCSYSLSAASLTIAATGGPESLAVSAGNGCSWSAQSQASWIQITGGSGTGSGSAAFTVALNSGPGGRTGTLVVAGQTITVYQPSMPFARVIPSGLTFGEEETGRLTSAQTVTFINAGSTNLSFISISIAGSAASDFLIQGNTCGPVLGPSASCSVAVVFQPTTAGTRAATLAFSDNAYGSIQTVSLAGTGIQYLPVSVGSIGPIPRSGDFDGDGRSDLVVWRPSNGTWYINKANGTGVIQQQWGLPGDIPVTGDFNGDKRTDFVVWRPSSGTWYVLFSNQAAQYPIPSMVQQWGLPGDIPVSGDYDGDGKTDFAVWRPSTGTWFVLYNSHASQYPTPSVVQQWGLPGDIPVPGDYDGDGKTDFAVWRPSNGTWYIIPSSDPAHPIIRQWGLPGDIPVPADFNGDGKDDLAVWRPSDGTWYVLTLSGATILQQWGLPGDLPQVGDFGGSGKASFAVLRPSLFVWFVLDPSMAVQWGLAGDLPE